jgi:hypothetical protein
VLDGTVLVLDDVTGVQAQTKTVWRSMLYAVETVERKLTGSSPLPVQFGSLQNVRVGTMKEGGTPHGEFNGVLDFVNMRSLIYPPNAEGLSMEDAVPTVVNLMNPQVWREGDNRQICEINVLNTAPAALRSLTILTWLALLACVKPASPLPRENNAPLPRENNDCT